MLIQSCIIIINAISIDNVIFLFIEEMPIFIRIFQDQIHMPGQVVSLHCSASGSPLPQIAWTLDGEPLSESRRVKTGDYVHMDGSVLSYVNITDLAVSDGGLYGCEAKNDVGSVSHSARIDVYGPPYIRPMGNLTVVAGTTVTIRCPVSGYPIDRPYVEKSKYLKIILTTYSKILFYIPLP